MLLSGLSAVGIHSAGFWRLELDEDARLELDEDAPEEESEPETSKGWTP